MRQREGPREVLLSRRPLHVLRHRAEPRGKDLLFFGFCVSPLGSDCDEWGYTSLTELLSVRVRGLAIERDLHLPFATRTVGELLRSAA